MKPKIQAALLRSCAKFLPSIVRLLIRNDINCRQFVEAVKRAYVEVVTEEYGIDGRPANVSKTAIMTGLTRPDIQRIRANAGNDPLENTTDQRRYDMTALLADWHNNAMWQDENGKPLELPLTGDEQSFRTLVQKHFGSIPATAVLRELKQAMAVEQTNEKKIRVLRNFYRPAGMSIELAEHVGDLLNDFLDTAQNNITHLNDGDEEALRVENRATQTAVARRHLPAYRAMLREETLEFCTKVDLWLEEKKLHDTKQDEATMRLGVGVYQINGD